MATDHTIFLAQEASWVRAVFKDAINEAWKKRSQRSVDFSTPNQDPDQKILDVLPDIPLCDSPYALFLRENELNWELRMLLMLAMINHLFPEFLSSEIDNDRIKWELCREIGGVRGQNFPGFIPTGQTYVFMRGRYNLSNRIEAAREFHRSNPLSENGVVTLEPHFKGEPTLSGKLTVEERWIEKLIYGVEEINLDSIKYST